MIVFLGALRSQFFFHPSFLLFKHRFDICVIFPRVALTGELIPGFLDALLSHMTSIQQVLPHLPIAYDLLLNILLQALIGDWFFQFDAFIAVNIRDDGCKLEDIYKATAL
jgi:hypothetical protein